MGALYGNPKWGTIKVAVLGGFGYSLMSLSFVGRMTLLRTEPFVMHCQLQVLLLFLLMLFLQFCHYSIEVKWRKKIRKRDGSVFVLFIYYLFFINEL